MKRIFPLFLMFVAVVFTTNAQVSLTAVGTPTTIDFTGFQGAGFETAPVAGQLSSNNWAFTGFSDGDMAFGGSSAAIGDLMKGVTTGGITSGGLYAYDDGSDQSMYIQSTGGDFTPGTITLRMQNNTGTTMNQLDLAYDIVVLNDATRAISFNLSFSEDDATYTNMASLDYTTTEPADATPAYTQVPMAGTINGINVADGGFFYVRWTLDDAGGSGSRDEIGLDNISLTVPMPSATPEFNFATTAVSVDEGAGTADVTVSISSPADCTVEVAMDAASTAMNGSDFTYTLPATLTFTMGGATSQTITIPITDDATVESDETIVLNLQMPGGSGGCALGSSTQSIVTITDNDYPIYPIGMINTEDAMGTADSVGVTCIITGVVHCIDLRGGSGYDFHMVDANGDGIAVFSFNDVDAYTVTPGDEITMAGTIGQFRGLTQIQPLAITVNSSGNALTTPMVLTAALGEAEESLPVSVPAVQLVDAAQWTTSMGGFGFYVDVTDGTNTWQVLIDSDVMLYDMPAPMGWFSISGIARQRSSSTSAPMLDNYFITPCSPSEIVAVAPSLAFAMAADSGDESASPMVDVAVNNPLPVAVTVDVAVDAASTATDGVDFTLSATTLTIPAGFIGTQMVSIAVVDDADNEADETVVLNLTNASANGTITMGTYTYTILDNDPVGVQQLAIGSFQMYPNPVQDQLTIELKEAMDLEISVFNVLGQNVFTQVNNNSLINVDLSNLNKGVYLVRLTDQTTGKTATQKITVK